MIDFWFEHSPGPVPDIRPAAKAYRQNQRSRFTAAVRTTIQPLEAEGYRFTYPHGPLEDHPLISICLGFEIESFEAQFLQLTRVLAQLISFPLEFHFIYVAPLLNGKLITPTVMRIARDTILGQENRTVSSMPILPVEPPEGFFEVLPLQRPASSTELELLGEFHKIYGDLNTCRNTLYFVTREIDKSQPFELELANKYGRRLQDQRNALFHQQQSWSEKALQLAGGNPAASHWMKFYELCLNRFQQFDSLEEIDIEHFEPFNILADIELQTAFNEYMDAEDTSTPSP